jgi:hypothetical protein
LIRLLAVRVSERLVGSVNLNSVVKYGVNMSERYTIGTLARQVGINVETIRYY